MTLGLLFLVHFISISVKMQSSYDTNKQYQIHFTSMTVCWLFYYVILEGNDKSSYVLCLCACVCICSWWTLWMFACLWMSVVEAQLRFSLPEMCSWERWSSIRTNCGPGPIRNCSMALTVCGRSVTLQFKYRSASAKLVFLCTSTVCVCFVESVLWNVLMVVIKKCSAQLIKAMLWLPVWEEVN